jgi:hypothetical protein
MKKMDEEENECHVGNISRSRGEIFEVKMCILK